MGPDISVIIEWENILLAKQARCADMLGRLRRQALAARRAVEVLVTFNPRQVERTAVEAAVARHLAPADSQGRTLTCRILAGDGLHYYLLKNLGVRAANGQVVAFLDSDVVPEDGWLDALTEPFWAHPEIQVLAGHTYLDHQDLPGRAFALGWFFPLPATHPVLKSDGRHFFANNVAFRRPIIAAHPFPEMAEGMTRGACVQLADRLRREGIEIWQQGSAQTSHPAPNGLAHFVARGLAQGRDWALAREQAGIPAWRTGLRAMRQVFSNSGRMLRRAVTHGHAVDLAAWQVPLAVGLMTLFYIENCLGAWAYALAPRHARQWWQI